MSLELPGSGRNGEECWVLSAECSGSSTSGQHSAPSTQHLSHRRQLLFAVVFAAFVLPAASDSGGVRDRAEQLLSRAEEDAANSEYGRATAALDEALTISREIQDPTLEARCLDLLGTIANGQGEHAIGRERQEKALELARGVGDPRLEGRILAHVGHGYWMQAQYDRALELHHQALAIQERVEDREGIASTLTYIGLVHFKLGEYALALENHRRALAMRTKDGDIRGLAESWEDIGYVYRDQDAYAAAVDAFDRALLARERVGDRPGQGSILTEIGICYWFQGALQEALAYFRRSLQIAESGANPAGRASALYHLGMVYNSQGDARRAIEYLTRVLAIREQTGDRRAQAWDLAAIAEAFEKLDEHPRAMTFRTKAHRIWEEIRDWRALASDLDSTGVACYDAGDYTTALQYHLRAMEIQERIQLPYLPLAAGNIGRIYARLGEKEKALAYGQRAVEEAARTGNPRMQWEACYRMGTIQRDAGMKEEALRFFRESIAVIEEMRKGVLPEDEARTGFLEDKQVVYGDTIMLLYDLGRAEEALEMAERARARAFLDLLGARALAESAGGTASPSEEPQDGMTLRGTEVGAAGSGRGDTGLSGMASIASLQPPPLGELRQEARRRRSTIVEYFSTSSRLLMWVVGPDGAVHTAASPARSGELERIIREMRERMQTASAGAAEQMQLLRRLHALLVAPIARWLPSKPEDLVTIIPHGSLFLVSFAALTDGDGKYFIHQHTINYSPAISVLKYTGANEERIVRGTEARVLVVGNPTMPRVTWMEQPLPQLPGAEAEAQAVRGQFSKSRVTLLMGESAGEQAVKEAMPAQSIIHFATHGVIRDDMPLESFLALTPSSSGDGHLTVRDIFAMNLHADLVVLSACNTGLGKVNGDGVIGLSRAFMYAGTPSAVVSLWRVADITAHPEMEAFYRALTAPGGTKAAALRSAQLEIITMLRNGAIKTPSGKALPENPVYWAPFILVGEAS